MISVKLNKFMRVNIFKKIIIILLIPIIFCLIFCIGYIFGEKNIEKKYEYLDVIEDNSSSLSNFNASLWREAALTALIQMTPGSKNRVEPYISKKYLDENVLDKKHLIDTYKMALFSDAFCYKMDPTFPIDSSRTTIFWMKKLGYFLEREDFDVCPNMSEIVKLLENGDVKLEHVTPFTANRSWFYPGNYEKILKFAEKELSKRSDLENFIERTWDDESKN